MTADSLRRSEKSSASLSNKNSDDYLEDDDYVDSGCNNDNNTPFLSRRSLSKASFEAGHAFVNAMIVQSSDTDESATTTTAETQQPAAAAAAAAEAASDIGTPRSILMSRRLGQAHADAVLPQLSPRMPTVASGIDLHSMPPLVLDDISNPAAVPLRHASTLTIDSDALPFDDEDVVSRRLELEIRKMMIQAHSVDGGDEGMSEGPHELRRIGEALTRCMAMRSKYMNISLQRESDNPRNHKQWQIYPAPPPPAWRNFDQPVKEAAQDFDLAQCAIPGNDEGCSFAMTEEGVYAVSDSNGTVFTSAP
ncbi:AMP deaminase, partial [Coemansia aciculifera]